MISLILVLALAGLLVWAITNFIPMPPQFKTLIIVVAVVCALLYVLAAFGVVSGISMPSTRTNIHLP